MKYAEIWRKAYELHTDPKYTTATRYANVHRFLSRAVESGDITTDDETEIIREVAAEAKRKGHGRG